MSKKFEFFKIQDGRLICTEMSRRSCNSLLPGAGLDPFGAINLFIHWSVLRTPHYL